MLILVVSIIKKSVRLFESSLVESPVSKPCFKFSATFQEIYIAGKCVRNYSMSEYHISILVRS